MPCLDKREKRRLPQGSSESLSLPTVYLDFGSQNSVMIVNRNHIPHPPIVFVSWTVELASV